MDKHFKVEPEMYDVVRASEALSLAVVNRGIAVKIEFRPLKAFPPGMTIRKQLTFLTG